MSSQSRPVVATPPGAGLGGVVGHLPQLVGLKGQLQQGRLAPAYFVSGPDQVGKTALALALAQDFLAAGSWPGGLAGHPDLWLEDSGSTSIGIDRIRMEGQPQDALAGPSLQHFLSLTPYAGLGKFAVLANCERLSLPAANSLLRLLEEPPPRTVIWLCTSRPESEHLPPTLRSRCQPLSLGPVDPGLIVSWLESTHGVAPEAARVATALCQGRPGLALELARDPELTLRANATLERFLGARRGSPAQLLELSRELGERASDRGAARDALRVLASFLRDCCCRALDLPELCRWPDQAAASKAWAADLGLAECSRRYDLALEALGRLGEMATPRLVLDRLLLLGFDSRPSQEGMPGREGRGGR
ncbi:MAG: hypothetical protein ACREOL_03600 [Candidatus Dormibacteria bacterium]